MGFKGKIEDLPILDVIQYLNAGGKTGTLIFEKGEEKAFVYFQKGNIVHALSSHRMNLGDILLEKKYITLRDLKEALVLQRDSKKRSAIGQILVDMGTVPAEKLREAVLAQIRSTIRDLVKWNKGEFEFKNNEMEAVDDINLNPTELILESDINTQSLLMEAAVSMDGAESKEDPETKKALTSAREPGGSRPAEKTPFPEQKNIGGMNPPVNLNPGKGVIPGSSVPGENSPGVLVFSPDGIFKNLLRTYLGQNGLHVLTPGTIEDCLFMLKKFQEAGEFRVVFIEDGSKAGDRERHRPGMRILREKERAGWDFPLVILLNEMKQDEVWDFYNAGARAVLPKPSRETLQGDQFIRSIEKLGELILKKTRFLHREKTGGSP